VKPPALDIPSATRRVSDQLQEILRSLQPGQRIRITQRVRVGGRQWTTTTEGAFRDLNYLVTGLATQRVPDDDIVVPLVHFTKDNGEMSSIALDEHSVVERMG